MPNLKRSSHNTYREAYIGDALAITSIYAAGQLPEILALTPLGAKGAKKYVETVIRAAREGSADRFWVTLMTDVVVGFLELSLSLGQLKVNNIFINAQQQGKGIGGRLLLHALSKLWLSKTYVVILDVFSRNTTAVKWYESLGFKSALRHSWLNFPLPDSTDEEAYYVIQGLPEAAIAHQYFGFSRIRVLTEHCTYCVGCMGNEWFRLDSVDGLGDQGLLQALKAIDPSRKIVLIAKEDELSQLPLLGQAEIAKSIQMRTTYSILSSRLSSRYGS